ncbi:hypothetical protein GUITHDRAFT_147101 [Guillardia theta CCMP2712]|uniref:Uncharacterized protein n=1 Tax=Guillardia theta (strain CCMP2712) TaxID=905079 RepID=L1IEC1_GUITC|nr:hypothetical protein GUITHDRAFT_147101 [Guillardia theta CCMP2712]EKX34578.1 hypothetical protein GUITHDRAFT_147101 [Guillardia theta CCMP2712]|eukprot:XP_005821558.1 hypothetical protein GUITHDRAFT_147101 [Guillardia theta CCMP2712]
MKLKYFDCQTCEERQVAGLLKETQRLNGNGGVPGQHLHFSSLTSASRPDALTRILTAGPPRNLTVSTRLAPAPATMSRAQTPRSYTPRQWTGGTLAPARDLQEADQGAFLRSQSVQSAPSAAPSSLALNLRGSLFSSNQTILLQRAITQYTPRINAMLRRKEKNKPGQVVNSRDEDHEQLALALDALDSSCSVELDNIYASLSREASPETNGADYEQEEEGKQKEQHAPLSLTVAQPAADYLPHATAGSSEDSSVSVSGRTSQDHEQQLVVAAEEQEKDIAPARGQLLGNLREFPRPMRGAAGQVTDKKEGKSKWGLGVGGRGLEATSYKGVSLKGSASYSSPLGENIRLILRRRMPDLLSQREKERTGHRPSSAESKRTTQVPRIKRSRSQCSHMKDSTNTVHQLDTRADPKLEAQGGRRNFKELYQRPTVKFSQPVT